MILRNTITERNKTMLNMEKVGQKISELRKFLNMTQMELADKMNISFQAVSNWERGNTMPDISKLPELAGLFGITIDELLGEKSELLESVLNDKTSDYLKNNSVTSEDFKKIVPILKPKQTDEIFEKANPSFVISEVTEVLPFINRDILNQLALKSAEECNYKELDEILPFIDKKIINIIANKIISEGKNISEIAPFVSKEIIGELGMSNYNQKGLTSLEDFLPFIPCDIMRNIAEQEYSKHGLKHFDTIAPFLDKIFLNEMAQKALLKDGIKAISSIAPFLDKNMLSKFIEEKFL